MTALPEDEAWTFDDIEAGVCDVLAEVLERPAGTIRPGSPLDEGLGVDSLALIQAQVSIEERFGVVMPDIDEDALTDLRTVEDLVRPVADQALGRRPGD